jgi:hypothetical protein
MLLRVGVRDGGEHALARVAARQAKHALNEANGADAAGGERRSGPLLECRPDARAPTDEPIDKRLLPGRGFWLTGARRKQAGGHAAMDRDERVVVEDAHQMGIDPHTEFLPEQRERHRVKRAANFHMAVGMDGPRAAREERKRLAGQRL